MGHEFKVVYSGGDPLEAQLLQEILLDNQLNSRLMGTLSPALVGAGQMIFEQRIEVPAVEVEQARGLIEAFLADEVEAGEDQELEQAWAATAQIGAEAPDADPAAADSAGIKHPTRKGQVAVALWLAVLVGLLVLGMALLRYL